MRSTLVIFGLFSTIFLLLFSCTHRQQQNLKTQESSSNSTLDTGIYIPTAIGWTNDFVGLLSEKEIYILDSVIANYERKSSVEISIAILDTLTFRNIEFDDYTLLLARKWGVGKQESNNGILIGLAPQINSIRIQNGFGIEKFLSDQETLEIIDKNFIPEFKKGKYFDGLHSGILAIINKLEKNSL